MKGNHTKKLADWRPTEKWRIDLLFGVVMYVQVMYVSVSSRIDENIVYSCFSQFLHMYKVRVVLLFISSASIIDSYAFLKIAIYVQAIQKENCVLFQVDLLRMSQFFQGHDNFEPPLNEWS